MTALRTGGGAVDEDQSRTSAQSPPSTLSRLSSGSFKQCQRESLPNILPSQPAESIAAFLSGRSSSHRILQLSAQENMPGSSSCLAIQSRSSQALRAAACSKRFSQLSLRTSTTLLKLTHDNQRNSSGGSTAEANSLSGSITVAQIPSHASMLPREKQVSRYISIKASG